jgi:two-component system NtrC family sensor kinase
VRLRIGTQVILAAALAAGVAIAAVATLVVRAQRTALVDALTRSANQVGETIESATHDDMLQNRREGLASRIEAIGAQPGIESLRLYNKDGRIAFSADRGEVGRSVDKRADACYACHAGEEPLKRLAITERARVFRSANGHRVLGIIHPIANRPSCSTAACHAHSPRDTVLGVLDVAVSLEDADRSIASSQRSMVALAAAAIVTSSVLLWWLNRRLVLRPVETIAAATHRVAAGDLTTKIRVSSRNELGELANDFNEMVGRLAETQRQLTQADKLAAVGRLAAGVAHEINNPLTGVLTYASFLLKRAENAESKADLEVIVRETKRCREIVKGLLDFARQSPPRRQLVDINRVVQRAVEIVAHELSLRHITLSIDLSEPLSDVEVDPNQVQQVLINLLLNAAEAIGEGPGNVTVRAAERPPETIEIVVEDSGRGIAPEDKPHIFDPFFSTKGVKGTGLGLAVTWGIVDAHGGTIEVDSRPGEGARFSVRLPRKAPEAGRT